MFLKHIGKHGDRKVAILFKTVPGEEHMCLVIYPEVLPAPWHDSIMKVLESDIGQQAEELANALHRSLLPDGRNILETLHLEKMLKKVRTNEIVVTPRPNSHVRLDELNSILAEMKTGEQAIKRMAELDSQRGMVSPDVKRKAEAEFKKGVNDKTVARNAAYQASLSADPNNALSDHQIAANMLAQAKAMEQDAKGLVNEANRMKKEAARMSPGVVASTITESNSGVVESTTKPKRTRKNKTLDNATA
jgi:hypothetical protein